MSQTRKRDAFLGLIFAAGAAIAERIRHLAGLIALEEEELTRPFIGVDLCGKGCRIGKFECDVAFPAWLEWRDITEDAGARVSGFSDADDEDIFWDTEIFHGPAQNEAVRRNDAAFCFTFDETFRIEVFRIDDGVVDIGEDFEFFGNACVIAVAREAVANDAFSFLLFDERFDHALLFCKLADRNV